jgi:hypothetical protein
MAQGAAAPPPTARLALPRQAGVPEDAAKLAAFEQTRGLKRADARGLQPPPAFGHLPLRGRIVYSTIAE